MTTARDPVTGQSAELVRRVCDIRAGAEAMARVVWDPDTDDETTAAALFAFASTLLDLRRLVPDSLFHQYRPDLADTPTAIPSVLHAVPDLDEGPDQ
ncbi:MAG: hypothetical protein AAGA90_07845 [Actinomycetota bacterium]